MRQEAVKEWIFIVYSGHVCRLRKTGPGFSAEYEPQTEMLPSGRLVPEIDARNLGCGPQLGIWMSAPPPSLLFHVNIVARFRGWEHRGKLNLQSIDFHILLPKKALNLLFDRECPKRAPDGRIPEILLPAGKCGRYGFAHTCCPAWPRVLRAFRYRRVLQPNSRRNGHRKPRRSSE